MTVEIFDFDQGSEDWIKARLGIPTTSEFKSILAKGEGKMRRTYMMKLLGERFTGEPADNFSNGHMERGKEMEDEARRCYAFMQDQEPARVGFIRNGDIGCSPDSLIGEDGMVEIKTKLPHLQLEAIFADRLPPEHKAQVQGQLWVAEREWCEFVSYWPRLPLFVKRVYRDEDYIKTIAEAVDAFNEELDALTQKLIAGGQAPADPKYLPIPEGAPC
jgi:hypothetical protein